MIYRTLIFLFYLSFAFLYCITPEEYIEISDNELQNQLIEQLENLQKNKKNINTITQEELNCYFWLSQSQIRKIMQKQGSIKSLKNLQFDKETIESLNDFFYCEEKASSISFKLTEKLQYDYSDEELESPINHYQRLTIDFRNFSTGFISQKDPEEISLLDHYAGYLQYSGRGFVRKAILGCYKLQIGQGLTMSADSFGGRDARINGSGYFKNSKIRAYGSSTESGYLRGSALEFGTRKFNLILFGSITEEDVCRNAEGVTSFDTSGIHKEDDKRDVSKSTIGGMVLSYKSRLGLLEIGSYYQDFSEAFSDPAMKQKYTAFSLHCSRQSEIYRLAMDYGYISGQSSYLITIRAGEQDFKQLFRIRFYSQKYPTWNSNALDPQNEQGLLYGFCFKMLGWDIHFYTDYFSYPGVKYLEKMATTGIENSIYLKKKLSGNELKIRLRRKDREKYIKLDDGKIRDLEEYGVTFSFKQNLNPLQLSWIYKYSQEYLPVAERQRTGNLFQLRLRLSYDWITFYSGITSYHGSILLYGYENNLSNSFGSTILSGDGFCSYSMIKLQISNNLQLEFRIGDNWDKSGNEKLGCQIIWQS